MPEYFYCLKCSNAKYTHGRGCRSQTTHEEPYRYGEGTFHVEAHERVDLRRMPYCSWEKNYIRLKRIYSREYNPANWKAVGWYCPNCNNFIKG